MDLSPSSLLLSVADRRVARILKPGEFDRVLVTSLLFEPQVVMSDVYFFNSPAVLAHVRSSGNDPSLIELALREAAIVPAVRREAKSFREIAAYLRGDHIYGLLPPDDIDYLAERLSVKRIEASVVWPDRMAASYSELLRAVLQHDTPPARHGIQIDQALWVRTERFRYQALDSAIEEESNRPEGYGVRRAEVIRKTAELIGVMEPTDELLTEDQILNRFTGPAEECDAVDRFFGWLDELYFTNQAIRFGVRPTTSTRQLADISVIETAVGLQRATSPPAISVKAERLEMEVDIPEFETIRLMSPASILALREYGINWYASAGAFMKSPNVATKLKAEWALEEFSRRLRREVRTSALERMEVKISPRGLAYATGESLLEFVQFFAQLPPLHSLIAVARHGWLFIQYHRKIPFTHVRLSLSPHEASRFTIIDR